MENFDNASPEIARARVAEQLRLAREPRLPSKRRRHSLGRRYRNDGPLIDN